MKIDLRLSRVINNYVLKQETEKNDGLFTSYIRILMWVCSEYLNFPYDCKKYGNNYITINHCPHCMSVILNTVLDLMIIFIELNKFDMELSKILKKSLIELRKKDINNKNGNCEDKCYNLLSTYLLKLISHFITLTSSTQSSSSTSSVGGGDRSTTNTSIDSKKCFLLVDTNRQEIPPFFSLDDNNPDKSSLFLPIIPFRKLLMLTEKVLLNTLSEECGSCITTPTNLNFCCYSSLPQVPIMAKEIIDMRLPENSLKDLESIFSEGSDEKNRKIFESNCLDERNQRLFLLHDTNGNNFQMRLPGFEKHFEKFNSFMTVGSLYTFDYIHEKLKKYEYFNRKEDFLLYWYGEELSKGKESEQLYVKVNKRQTRSVYDGLFLVFKSQRTSFYVCTKDFIDYKKEVESFMAELKNRLKPVQESFVLHSLMMNSVSNKHDLDSPNNIFEAYLYEWGANTTNKFCSLMFLFFFFLIFMVLAIFLLKNNKSFSTQARCIWTTSRKTITKMICHVVLITTVPLVIMSVILKKKI
jgi:hypothetical protein